MILVIFLVLISMSAIGNDNGLSTVGLEDSHSSLDDYHCV